MTGFLSGAKDIANWLLTFLSGNAEQGVIGLVPTIMDTPILAFSLYTVVISLGIGVFKRLSDR